MEITGKIPARIIRLYFKMVDKFERRINKNGPIPQHCPELGQCWIYTGQKTSYGYGTIGVNRTVKLAHRLSYEFYIGDIPIGMLVCHRCDNPTCIRPSHLFVGTQKENSLDMRRKNRSRRIKDSKIIKKLELVKYLKEEYGYSNLKISKILKLDSSNLSKLLNGKLYSYINVDMYKYRTKEENDALLKEFLTEKDG